MNKKQRGAWVPDVSTPEIQQRRAHAKFKLEKEGTITKDTIAFKLRREQQTAQPRKRSANEDSVQARSRFRRF